jgi:RNA polymerase sigma-70 factor (ECF subfamily)
MDRYDRLRAERGEGFDTESAADAVQEAFIEADRRWRRISRYDDPTGWIRRVALNRLRNGERNRRRRLEILDGIQVLPDEDVTADLVDLRRALEQLPERSRLIVSLHYLAALSVAEVASTLEIADGTVKSTLRDARKRLRPELQEERHA